MPAMATLSNELLDSIFSYLPRQDLCVVTKTCRSFAKAGNRALYTNVSVNTADRDGIKPTDFARLFILVRTILTDQTLANHVQSAELLGLGGLQTDSTLEAQNIIEVLDNADGVAKSLIRFPLDDFDLLEKSLLHLGDRVGFKRISTHRKWVWLRDCLYALFLSRVPRLRKLVIELEPSGGNPSLCFAVEAALQNSDACLQRFEHLEELDIRAYRDLKGSGEELVIPFYSIPSLRSFTTNAFLPIPCIPERISNIETLVFNGWSPGRTTGIEHVIKACKSLKSFTFKNWPRVDHLPGPTTLKAALDTFKATLTSVTLFAMPEVWNYPFSTEDASGWFRDYKQLTHLSISHSFMSGGMRRGWPLPSLLPASLEYLELEGIDDSNASSMIHGLEQLAQSIQGFPNLKVLKVSMSEEYDGLAETCAPIFEYLNMKVHSQTLSFQGEMESDPETNISVGSGLEEWNVDEMAEEWEN